MNTVEFIENIPAEKVAEIFKDYFEQHMAVYDMLRGMEFISLNDINIDTASIMYSIKTLDEKTKLNLYDKLISPSGSLNIYGKMYTPEVFINGDLLCITIHK